MEYKDIKGFTYLILDTNWWMFLAKGEHRVVLDKLKLKVEDGSIILLVPETVLNEWKNHKNDVILGIKEVITKGVNEMSKIKDYLDISDGETMEKIIKKYKNDKINKDAEKRYNEVCYLIEKKGKKIKVSNKVKNKAVEFALEKKAPFGTKNSMADALIVFSSIEFLAKEEYLGKNNAIFVSFNHHDFSEKTDKKEDKKRYMDILHNQLIDEFNTVGLKYKREFYEALSLSEELNTIAKARLEDEYWDYIDAELEWQVEVERGR